MVRAVACIFRTLNRIAPFTREFWLAQWKSPVFRGALLILVTLLAYLPATRCGYIWDDDVYVTDNPLLSAPDGLWRIWFSFDSPSQYFPLVYTTLRLEHALWGLSPLGYHCVNILLHGVNALLLWRLLVRLEIPGAWAAAAIFAVHPVQVESVAWVTELKNVQMGFFFLLTLLAWTAFNQEGDRRDWRFYGLSLVFYALALFSKTTACTLPGALLLILWWRGERIGWRRVIEVMPYGALGIGMGLLTVWWERYHQGTQGKLFTMGLPERVLIAARGVWFYADKLFWPAKLTFSYPRWALPPAEPAAGLWLVALCGLGGTAFFARRIAGRGVFAALAFYVVTLGPILGLLMLYTFRYSFVADHYQYLACIGPITLVCAGAATLAHRYPTLRKPAGAAAAFVIVILGVLTWRQCRIYRNDESIWRDTLLKNPESLMAHYNLANGLMRDGAYTKSLAQYNRAVEIDPTFFEARCNRAEILVRLGRLPEAAADYQEAVAIEPDSAVIQNSYGTLLAQMGRTDDAIAHLREAARLQPHSAVAEKNLADALASKGDFAGALPHYEEVARLFPDAPQSHMILARTYVSVDRIAEAIGEYREAIRLAPRSAEALTRLAWLLAQSGDPKLRNSAEAVALATRACDLTHYENAVSIETLAAAYAAAGRLADAITASHLAIDAATNAGDEKSAADFQKQMELYEKAGTQNPGPLGSSGNLHP
jgi:tetratricopeptide (TPR) repeat protein